FFERSLRNIYNFEFDELEFPETLEGTFLNEEIKQHYEYALFCMISSYKEEKYLNKLSDRNQLRFYEREKYLSDHEWILLPTSKELGIAENGYFGVAYYQVNEDNTATVVIAHRGTCFDEIDNLLADLQIMEKRTPVILNNALQYASNILNNDFSNSSGNTRSFFIEGIPVSKIVHVGFSLGGFIATASMINSRFPETYAVTFDAAGADYLRGSKGKSNHVISYVTTPNIVNTCNSHIGEIRRLIAFPEQSTSDEKISVGTTVPGHLDLLAFQELLETLETHDLDRLISVTSMMGGLQYKKVSKWPVAKIEPIYGPKASIPEVQYYGFKDLKSSVLSVGSMIVGGSQIMVSKTLWRLTKRLDPNTGRYEGIIGINYQREDKIDYLT
ncbi:MAG: hypothetical protein KKE11_00155, partial [Gammaproteobacteria bacterium]|nr:hypothetical protein [Gammaproteobacteria bacterium]